MSAHALLADLANVGIQVSFTGDKLRVRGSEITADLRHRLTEAKPELLAYLRADLRNHMLTLAEANDVPLAIVHGLSDEDLAACGDLPDDTLLAYLRGLVRGRDMNIGVVPPDWTHVAQCDGCGPVWWWRAEHLKACPWCFKRKAGKHIPQPNPQGPRLQSPLSRT